MKGTKKIGWDRIGRGLASAIDSALGFLFGELGGLGEYLPFSFCDDLAVLAEKFVIRDTTRHIVLESTLLEVIHHDGRPGKPFFRCPSLSGLLVTVEADMDHLDARIVCDLGLVLLHQLWSRSAAGRSPTRRKIYDVVVGGLGELVPNKALSLKLGKDSFFRQILAYFLFLQGIVGSFPGARS